MIESLLQLYIAQNKKTSDKQVLFKVIGCFSQGLKMHGTERARTQYVFLMYINPCNRLINQPQADNRNIKLELKIFGIFDFNIKVN